MFKKTVIGIFVFLIVLLFFCTTYYHDMLFRMPYGIHTWAQSDRLSLAINFYDNGMNFFKPATYNIYSEQGITGVEFPIQAYIAALSGKIFGREYISISFRLLDITISCTGLLFLFLAGYRVTKDFIISLITPLFIFCSPIFIYYTCNYLPDATAAAIAFIAFYYILGYISLPSRKNFLIALFLLTLATLIKTSLGLYLLGFIVFVLWQHVRNEKTSINQHLTFYTAILISVGIVVGYYLYNRHLNAIYHSTVFLATVKPFTSFNNVAYFFSLFKNVWVKEYFVLPQYSLLILAIAAAMPILYQSKTGKKLLFLSLLFLCGVLCVATLMGKQLYDHDYYAVSIFIPLLTFVLLISVIAIRQSTTSKKLLISIYSGSLAAILICFFFADYHIHQRLANGYQGFYHGPLWSENGALVFNQLRIAQDEKILVLDADDPNTHLLFFDRRGINVCNGNWKNLTQVIRLMHTYHIRIMVCDEDTGRSLLSNDNTLQSSFNTLYLQDRKAVFQLK